MPRDWGLVKTFHISGLCYVSHTRSRPSAPALTQSSLYSYEACVLPRQGEEEGSQITRLIGIGRVLILHGFHIGKSTYSLTFICNSERMVFSRPFKDIRRTVRNLSHLLDMFLVRSNEATLCLLVLVFKL